MPVVLALAALVIIAATVAVALGYGGGLAEALPDHPPSGLPADRVPQATDVRLLRLPKSPWGYNTAITDDALARLADAIGVQEERVARLESELAALRAGVPAGFGSGSTAAEARWDPAAREEPQERTGEEEPWNEEPWSVEKAPWEEEGWRKP